MYGPYGNFRFWLFYSNWTLHTRIDREPWAKEGLKRLEEVVSGFNSGTHDAEAVLKGVTGLLSFQRLHAEFLGFGAENNIRFDQLSNEEWRQFSTLLVDVLVDCPIVSELDTTTVKGLSLSRDFAFSHAGGQTLAFWKIDLGQGKVMQDRFSDVSNRRCNRYRTDLCVDVVGCCSVCVGIACHNRNIPPNRAAWCLSACGPWMKNLFGNFPQNRSC